MKWIAALIAIMFALPLSAAASVDRFPPVTVETVAGVWEAISLHPFRLYRMEFKDSRRATLMMIHDAGPIFIWQLRKAHIENGHVLFAFDERTSDAKNPSVEVEGEGVASGAGAAGHGVLRVKLTVGPKGPHPSVWTLEFVLGSVPLVERLWSMERAAIATGQADGVRGGDAPLAVRRTGPESWNIDGANYRIDGTYFVERLGQRLEYRIDYISDDPDILKLPDRGAAVLLRLMKYAYQNRLFERLTPPSGRLGDPLEISLIGVAMAVQTSDGPRTFRDFRSLEEIADLTRGVSRKSAEPKQETLTPK